MPFITGDVPPCTPTHPIFCVILGNTLLSTVPGLSGAGPGPEKTLLTPNLDAELVTTGRITSVPLKPNTPTGCPTPATITRAMMELTGLPPLFINAGLKNRMTVPCIDALGRVWIRSAYGRCRAAGRISLYPGERDRQVPFQRMRSPCSWGMRTWGNDNRAVRSAGSRLSRFRQQQFCEKSCEQ